MKKPSVTFGTTSRDLIFVKLDSQKGREKDTGKKIFSRNNDCWRHSDWRFPKFDKNYKSKDPRITMKDKHKNHEDNCTTAYHNQIAQNQGDKNLKSSLKKRKHNVQKKQQWQ